MMSCVRTAIALVLLLIGVTAIRSANPMPNAETKYLSTENGDPNRNLKQEFKDVDANGDGKAELHEVTAFVLKTYHDGKDTAEGTKDAQETFAEMDTNKDGHITYQELV